MKVHLYHRGEESTPNLDIQEIQRPLTTTEKWCKEGTPGKTSWKEEYHLPGKRDQTDYLLQYLHRENRRICHPGVQEDVRCDRSIRLTGKCVVVPQCDSIKSTLEKTLGPQGWLVSQRSFIVGV